MNKVYLVLGASSDIGVELIKYLNKKESNLLIYAHYFSGNDQLKEISANNENEIISIQADLSNGNDVKKLISKICECGNIPNAIVHLPAPKLEFIKFKDLNWEDCIQDIEIQVSSIYKILQTLLPKMIKQEERSKIVFMLSENTICDPAKFSTKYTMSKYMLLGLMKSLTSEYRGKKINFNALSPSMIDTKLLSKIDRRMLEVTGVTDNILIPKDVIPYIMMLLSSESDEMFGENIYLLGEEMKNE